MALSVALQLFTVRDQMDADVEGTLRKVKELGYDGIEVCNGAYGMEPEAFKALCDEIGLKIISAHVGTDAIIKETEETLKLYKTLGASYIAISAFWGDYRYGEADYPEMIKKLDRAGAYFKENGIQILYHNHDWEFKKDNGKYHLDCIIDDTTNDNLLPELDVCWITIGHGNAVDYLYRYNGRCPVVHLKDFHCKGEYQLEKCNYERPNTFEFRPVGYGRVDMTAVLDASRDIGAGWVVVEQDTPTIGLTALESAEVSIKWLRTAGV